MVLAVSSALGSSTETGALQVAELHRSHRLPAHVLVARAGTNHVSTADSRTSLTHHHLLLSVLGSLCLLLLGLLDLGLHLSDLFLALLDLTLCLLELVLHSVNLFAQVITLDLQRWNLIGLSLGLLELSLERLRDEDSLILLLFHHSHLLELLFLLFHEMRVFVLKSAHIAQL